MRTRALAGVAAGLIGGLAFGVMMQMMTAPTPDGGRMPMMVMVAMVVGSESIAIGWAYHLFNSAVIGGLFGAIVGDRVRGARASLGYGAAWGVLWWILGALILMPVFLGMEPFAALRMPPMRPVAMGSLVGHLVYGLITGFAYARIRQGTAQPALRDAR
jgi:hypothetical protein